MMLLRSFTAASLALTAFASTASAEILTSFAWVQGSPGDNFAVMHADFDTDTSVLSVFGDYQGLQDDLAGVRVITTGGQALGTLAFDGLREGYARGNIDLSAVQSNAIRQSGFQVHFLTGGAEQVEMTGDFGFSEFLSRALPMDGDQVVGGAGAQTSRVMNFARVDGGKLIVTCDLSGIGLPMTGLELHGPAARGEIGPMILDLAPLNLSHSASVFFVEIEASTLSAVETQDFLEGFSYVLVRTAGHPDGAVRAQTSTGPVYETFCAGRPSSSSQIGGQLRLFGSVRIADASLQIDGQFFPPGQFVLPVVGQGSVHTYLPGSSQGTLCVDGAPITRLLAHVTQGQGLNSFNVSLDLGTLPSVQPGDTLRFQCWHRDVVDGQQTSNFSNAVSVRVR